MKKLYGTILIFFLLSSFLLIARDEYDEDLFSLPEDFESEIDVGETVTEEVFSLYGYLVNFLNINVTIAGNEVDNTDVGNVTYLRLKGDWNPGEHLSFHAELSYSALFGNQNPLVFFESAGLPAMIDQYEYPLDDFNQTLTIDHAWGSVSFWRCDIQFGKMPIAWGTGYAFNPTQRVSLMPFMDTVAEETPGTCGIAPGFSIIDELAIQGYVVFQDRTHKLNAVKGDAGWDNLPYGIKVQGILGSFDLSVCWIKEVSAALIPLTPPYYEFNRFYYIGSDFAGAIWDFGVYGEAVINLPRNADNEFDLEGHEFKDLLEVACGFDYTIPVIEVETRCEYYHQGIGETDKDDYDIARILSGEQVLQAEDYLFLYLEKTFLDYYRISAAGFINLNDGSLAIIPVFGYDMYGNFQVECGGTIFFGPRGSEFNGEYAMINPAPPPATIEIDLTQPALFLRAKLSF